MLCPPLGDLPDSGIEPGSPAWQANSLLAELPGNFLGDFFLGGMTFFFFFYCQKLDTSNSLNPAKPMGTHCTDIAAGGQIKFCAQGHTASGRPRNPMHLPVALRRGSQAARTRQPGHLGQKAGSIPRPSQQAILVGSPAEGPAPEALHPESWAQAGRRGRG